MKSATDEEGEPLLVVASPLRGKKGTEGYLVRLFSPVQSQESVKVEVELVFIDSVKPFPREISQVCTVCTRHDRSKFSRCGLNL